MKTIKRTLAVMLTLLMLISAVPLGVMNISVTASAVAYNVGDHIQFGTYPQTQAEETPALNAAANAATWRSYGYYSGTGNWSDGEMHKVDWMLFADFFCNGKKYRAVKFSQYRPYYTGGQPQDNIDDYCNQQEKNGYTPNVIYYFKYESLNWRILNPVTGFVMCEDAIDSQAYQSTVFYAYRYYWQDALEQKYACNYATSSIRDWLNFDFYETSFTNNQKKKIKITELNNSASDSSHWQYNSDSTHDKIFLLSYADVINSSYGFSSSGSEDDINRRTFGTDYAKCQGLCVHTKGVWWWLRSPGFESDRASSVFSDGCLYDYGEDVSITHGGIRPSCYLSDLTSDTSVSQTLFSEMLEGNQTESFNTGDLIQYGSYPQSLVTDPVLLVKLAVDDMNTARTWRNYWYCKGSNSGHWPANGIQVNNIMQFSDFFMDGEKYRAVRIINYRPWTAGVYATNYYSSQDENGYTAGNTYYFKYEPLTWRVLNPSAGYILCENLIDSQSFQNVITYSNEEFWQNQNENIYATNYEASFIREWLNYDFYETAFTDAQKENIETTTLNNDGFIPKYNGASTQDKVFLPSFSDVKTSSYGFSFSDNATRQATGTDYAKCQGLFTEDKGSLQSDAWWTRTASSTEGRVIGVNCDGAVDSEIIAGATDVGIRPACVLSTLMNNAAVSTNLFSEVGKGNLSDEILNRQMNNAKVSMKCDFSFADSYFKASSYTYNHKLAIASCCLATSAMVNDSKTFDEANKKPTAAINMLNDLGFGNGADGESVYYSSNYLQLPEKNSIACVISNKNIKRADTSIIAISIRGGGYLGEWAGNFNIGTNTYHEGFQIACNQVLDELSAFLNSHSTTLCTNLKFWVTGYSRSAAVANLVSKALNDSCEQSAIGVSNTFSTTNVDYEKKDIFSYCFETPRNTTAKDTKNSQYMNIFNIVNRIDPVPRVAPAAWGFTRYGKDCYLPSKETTGKIYSALLTDVSGNFRGISTDPKKEYKENFGYCDMKFQQNDWGLYAYEGVVDYNYSQGVFLDDFIDLLAKSIIGSRKKYINNLQNMVTAALYNIESGTSGSLEYVLKNFDFWEYLDSHFTAKTFLSAITSTKLKTLLIEALSIYGQPYGITRDDATDFVNALAPILVKLIPHPRTIATLIKNGGSLIVPHYTETTLAWLITLGGNYTEATAALSRTLTGGETYRVATINCPVNVRVYDADNELRGAIINEEVQDVGENGLSVCINEDGEKCFVMPDCEEFRFEIEAYDEGNMSLSFSDYNFGLEEKTESENYYDIPVESSTEIMAVLDKKSEQGIAADVAVFNEKDEILDSSEIIEYSEEKACTVSAICDNESGTVLGGGEYYKGEFSQVTALPNEYCVFTGWFEDGMLISNDFQYRFRVDRDVSLIAKFAPHTHVYDDGIITQQPTCEEEGVITQTCTTCNADTEGHFKTETIPKLGHTAPNKHGDCDRCGKHLQDVCKWCGKQHNGFFQKIIGFFHNILAAIFGKKY